MSSNVCTVRKREPGDVGLNLRIGMFYLRSLQELGQLFAFPQLYVRLLPVRPPADVASLAFHLSVRERRAHAFDLRTEQLLDGALDIDLVGVPGHLEHERAAVIADDGRLLGDQWTPDDVCQFHNLEPRRPRRVRRPRRANNNFAFFAPVRSPRLSQRLL